MECWDIICMKVLLSLEARYSCNCLGTKKKCFLQIQRQSFCLFRWKLNSNIVNLKQYLDVCLCIFYVFCFLDLCLRSSVIWQYLGQPARNKTVLYLSFTTKSFVSIWWPSSKGKRLSFKNSLNNQTGVDARTINFHSWP